jgi:hypothetical protein
VEHAIAKASVRLAAGSSTHSGTGDGWHKYPFDTIDLDTEGVWNVTDTRFQPIRAGWYEVRVQMALAGAQVMHAAVKKNGSTLYLVGSVTPSVSVVNNSPCGGSVLLQFNGSTDYAEGFLYAQASRTRSNTTGEQYFQIMGPL